VQERDVVADRHPRGAAHDHPVLGGAVMPSAAAAARPASPRCAYLITLALVQRLIRAPRPITFRWSSVSAGATSLSLPTTPRNPSLASRRATSTASACNRWMWKVETPPPSRRLEECLAEAFAIRGLARLADGWERNRPFPNDSRYAQALREYRRALMEKYRKAAGPEKVKDMAVWLRDNRWAFGRDHLRWCLCGGRRS
jgi:hypothetical protein